MSLILQSAYDITGVFNCPKNMTSVSSVEAVQLQPILTFFFVVCNTTSELKVVSGFEILKVLVKRWQYCGLPLHKAERVPKFEDTPVNLGDMCSWAVSYFHTATRLFLLLQISSFNCWPRFCYILPNHTWRMEAGHTAGPRGNHWRLLSCVISSDYT